MQCYLCSTLHLMYFDTHKIRSVSKASWYEGNPSQSALFVTINEVKVQAVLVSLTRAFCQSCTLNSFTHTRVNPLNSTKMRSANLHRQLTPKKNKESEGKVSHIGRTIFLWEWCFTRCCLEDFTLWLWFVTSCERRSDDTWLQNAK